MSIHLSADIAILGGGPAGYAAAVRAADLGARTVLIEERELGGVCLNRGCIPTKALLRNSEAAWSARKAEEFGLEKTDALPDWFSAWSRKERIVKNLRTGVAQLIASRKITLLTGKGEIVSPTELAVMTAEGPVNVSCRRVILATGSSLPSLQGIDLPGVLTSDDALNLQALPESVVIVGAGAVGLELADLFAGIRCGVTVLEAAPGILPREDREGADELQKLLKRRGVLFKTGAAVKRILPDDSGGLSLRVEEAGGESSISAHLVLIASGRRLQLPESARSLGVQADKNGAAVIDDKMETSVPGIYAAGDITGKGLFAHLAYAQGRAAAENALGLPSKVNYNAVPRCVYTHPELASVGLGEQEAFERGIPVAVGRYALRQNGRALTMGEREGFVKVVIHKDSHVILGGLVLAAGASEMISELTLAVELGATAETLARLMHPHPTCSEAIMEACGGAVGLSIHKMK